MFAIDGSSFLKVIDQWNTLGISKYAGKNLACWYLHLWSLWTAFTCCCPLSWLPICLWSEVMDPCFIHCHILCKISFLLCWNSCKRYSESLTCCYFRSTVSKRSTYFEHNFLIDKCSCKMVNTLPSDIFNSSAILYNFILLLAKTSLQSFLLFSRDNCWIWATWAFSIIYVYMMTFKVNIPPLNCSFQWSRVWITFIKPLLCLNSIFPIRKQCFINTWNSDFSIVLKICNNSYT